MTKQAASFVYSYLSNDTWSRQHTVHVLVHVLYDKIYYFY